MAKKQLNEPLTTDYPSLLFKFSWNSLACSLLSFQQIWVFVTLPLVCGSPKIFFGTFLKMIQISAFPRKLFMNSFILKISDCMKPLERWKSWHERPLTSAGKFAKNTNLLYSLAFYCLLRLQAHAFSAWYSKGEVLLLTGSELKPTLDFVWICGFSISAPTTSVKFTADITNRLEGNAKQDYQHVWSWKTFLGNIFDLWND